MTGRELKEINKLSADKQELLKKIKILAIALYGIKNRGHGCGTIAYEALREADLLKDKSRG